MPPVPKKPVPPAPDRKATVAEHRKHAKEILEHPDFKAKPAGFKEANDVVPDDE
jgi:hypothetical protein